MLTMNGIQGSCLQELLTSLAVARVQRVKSQSISLGIALGTRQSVLHTWQLTKQSKTGIRHCALTKNTQQISMIVTRD